MKKMIILFLMLSPLFFSVKGSVVTDRVYRQLEKHGVNQSVKVWIYFTDKDQSLKNTVGSKISQRSLRRRMKVMQGELIDGYDLPVKKMYSNAIRAISPRISVQSRWLNAVSVYADHGQILAMSALPFVKKIDLVLTFKKRPTIPSASVEKVVTAAKNDLDYGGSYTQNAQIHVPEVHDLGINGSGILICVLDNNFNLLEHQAFSSMNILATWDFIHGDSTVNEPGEGTHGTQTLSTVGGFSPGNLIGPAYAADFILGKTEVNASETQIEEDYWVAGAEWADVMGADVISSSLGYIDWYTWQDMDGQTAVTTNAADIAVGRGIVVVNSAGNEGSGDGIHNTIIAPADGDSVIAVGAVDGGGSRVYFSSVGPSADGRIKPDVAAMGSGVTVASPYDASGYTTSSGTSFSCPLTSGVAALVLSANPNLTPMQVREALRNTASQSGSPDNLLGWGIINAYDAVFYYSAHIEHIPLSDTENLAGPYTVTAQITSRIPLDNSKLKVIYGTDQTYGSEMLMTPTGTADTFSAEIPGVGSESDIYYYISAENTSQVVTTLPFAAPQSGFQFHVGADTVFPTITHQPLRDQSLMRWPAVVRATVSDNLGVDSVWVTYQVNSGADQNFGLQAAQGSDEYNGAFPIPADQLASGDVITYSISGRDASLAGNTTQSSSYSFQMIDVLGTIAIFDDDTVLKTDDKKPEYTRAQNKVGASAAIFRKALQNAGYLVDQLAVSSADSTTLMNYDLAISSSGGSTTPVSNTNYRQTLIDYVNASGSNKLIVEGGEVGYHALSSPGYPDFAQSVLHATSWQTDDAGPLQVNPSFAFHAITSIPNSLPGSIALNYSGYGDEDAIAAVSDAQVIFGTQNYPDAGGLIIYDDNANPKSAQIAVMAFNLAAISDTNTANALVENVIFYLLRSEVTEVEKPYENLVPDKFTVQQNYPNPFNPTTEIAFHLPGQASVRVQVFNTLGQLVVENHLGQLPAGQHKINFDGGSLASGVYYYRLITQNRKISTAFKKMLLIK